ncbi:hypothetical protein Gpo141_00008191 [Globisporangium polare]
MDGAAQNNHLHVVKWLHENRSEGCTTEAMNAAASRGGVEIVLFLHEHRSAGCDLFAVSHAHYQEHLNLFQWLCEKYPSMMKIDTLRRIATANSGMDGTHKSPLLA